LYCEPSSKASGRKSASSKASQVIDLLGDVDEDAAEEDSQVGWVLEGLDL
jgi:hypothetical protein